MTGMANLADWGLTAGGERNGGLLSRWLRAVTECLEQWRGRVQGGKRQRSAAARGRIQMDPWVVEAQGDLCDTQVLCAFRRRCEHELNADRRCGRADLRGVTRANSKLVATLISIAQEARAAGVPLDLTVSAPVRVWLEHYHVADLLSAQKTTAAKTTYN